MICSDRPMQENPERVHGFSECKDTQNILTRKICRPTFNYLYARPAFHIKK